MLNKIKSNQFFIKKRRPRHLLITAIVLPCFLLAVVYGSYRWSLYRADYEIDSSRQLINQLRKTKRELEKNNAALVERNAALDKSSQVDRAAYGEVKLAFANVQQELLTLKEDLAFYKSLMSPSEMTPGFNVQRLTVQKSEAEPKVFSYKLVLTQVRNNNKAASGIVEMILSGSQQGIDVNHSLSELALESTNDLKFKFKYFSKFEGSFRIPDEFEPEAILVKVKARGQRLKSIAAKFAWNTILDGGK